jgi:hypothetical protein
MSLELWHAGLCAVAVVNAAAWLWAARRLQRRAGQLPADTLNVRRTLLILSGIYVAGCAFRSALPMLDVQRICLGDTVLSRIVIGRSIATVAELAFVAQWALLLREAAGREPRLFVRQAALALLPLGVAAETASWLGVMTRDNLLHAVENSLWTLGAALVLVALVALLDHADRRRRAAIAVGIAAVSAYLAFMVAVDVPMYLERWRQASGEAALPLAVGFQEVLRRCTPTPAIAAWRADIPWLTLYFSAGVWLSIALVAVPSLAARRASSWGARAHGRASNSDRIGYGSARASRHRALRRS